MLQKLAGVKMPNEDAQKALTSLHAMMKEAVSTKLNLKMSAITEPLFTFNICRGWVGHQTLFLNDVQCWNMLPLNHKLQSRFCVIRFLDFTNLILRLSLRYASRRGLWNATSTAWRISVWIKMASAWTKLKRKPFWRPLWFSGKPSLPRSSGSRWFRKSWWSHECCQSAADVLSLRAMLISGRKSV